MKIKREKRLENKFVSGNCYDLCTICGVKTPNKVKALIDKKYFIFMYGPG